MPHAAIQPPQAAAIRRSTQRDVRMCMLHPSHFQRFPVCCVWSPSGRRTCAVCARVVGFNKSSQGHGLGSEATSRVSQTSLPDQPSCLARCTLPSAASYGVSWPALLWPDVACSGCLKVPKSSGFDLHATAPQGTGVQVPLAGCGKPSAFRCRRVWQLPQRALPEPDD